MIKTGVLLVVLGIVFGIIFMKNIKLRYTSMAIAFIGLFMIMIPLFLLSRV